MIFDFKFLGFVGTSQTKNLQKNGKEKFVMKSQKYIFEDDTKFGIDVSQNEVNILGKKITHFFTRLAMVGADFIEDIIEPFASSYNSEAQKFMDKIYYNTSAAVGMLVNISSANNIDALDIRLLRKSLNSSLAAFNHLYKRVLNSLYKTDEETSKKMSMYDKLLREVFKEIENLYEQINLNLEEKEKLLDDTEN